MKCIHNDITDKLDTFIKLKRIPNIIFHGETGSGKKNNFKIIFKKSIQRCRSIQPIYYESELLSRERN